MHERNRKASGTILAVVFLLIVLPLVASGTNSLNDTFGYTAQVDVDGVGDDLPTYARVWYSDNIDDTGVYTWRYNDTGQLKFDETVFMANETGHEYNTVLFDTYENDAEGSTQDRVYFFANLNSTSVVEDEITKIHFAFRSNTAIDGLEFSAVNFYYYDADGATDALKYLQKSLADADVTITGITNSPDMTWDDRPISMDVPADTWITIDVEIPTVQLMVLQESIGDDPGEIAISMYLKPPVDYNLGSDVWDYELVVYSGEITTAWITSIIWSMCGMVMLFMGLLATPKFNLGGH